SQDLFAVFNDPNAPTPNVWQPGFFFGGFDPTNCPGGQGCVPAGSFRINVWCEGNAPTGACCDRFAGTCTENVTFYECTGRWFKGGPCPPESFFPPCCTHSCCHKASFNPNLSFCLNLTPEACAQ